MESFINDTRYAIRKLAQRPGFALIALLTMALGIGANSAIFSIVNAILLRPLPVERPDQLVEIYSQQEEEEQPSTQAYPDYLDIATRDDLFSGVIAYTADFLSLNQDGRSEMMLGESVSGNYFDVLGVPAARGRTFIAGEDDQPGAPPVAVISHGLWTRRFAADPGIVGRVIALRGTPFEVIGVAPEEFSGLYVGISSQVWIPLAAQGGLAAGGVDLEERGSRWLFVKGRLREDVRFAQAQAGLDVLAAQLAEAYPGTNAERRFPLMRTSDVRIHPMVDKAIAPVAVLLMVVVGLVLLIACTNLANLLLARALGRRKEVAIRLALGAGRGRLIRQLLTESLLLALAGGTLGLLLARWTSALLVKLQPPTLFTVHLDLSLDTRVLAFTLIVSVVTGVLFGLAPALQTTRPQMVPALKDETAVFQKAGRSLGLRNSLVVGQVAVSLLLLIGAGLFVRSLVNAQEIDPGFERERAAVLTLFLDLNNDYTQEQGGTFLAELGDRVGSLPGVEATALATRMPLGASVQTSEYYPEGYENLPEDGLTGDNTIVSAGYFEAMNIPLLHGRDFGEQDHADAPPVVIVSEAAARRFWPGENAVGKQLRIGGPDRPLRTVVGVARDTKVRTLGEAPRPYIYRPFSQDYVPWLSMVVQTAGDPAPVLPMIRREVEVLDASMPIIELKTMSEHLNLMLFLPRMGGILLGLFGGLAMLLATTGLYGVIAYSASQRTREVGIRVALGAGRRDVVMMVVRQGLTLVAVGAAIGLALAIAATRPLGSLLYGVGAWDLATFVGVTLMLVAVALAASLVPALRAARVDPMVALRYE
jgi:predicted permease